MPPVPEAIIKRIDAIEKEQIKQELNNKHALELSAEENRSMFAAMQTEINEVKQEQKAFAPILAGINDSLVILVGDKTKRDTLAEAEAKKKPKTPWDIFKAKMIEAVATLIAGGIVAGAVYLAIQIGTKGHL